MAARPTDFTALAADGAYDVIVLGTGAAGFSAAVTAALLKQKVLLVERTEYVGGTSAFSAATTWIPNTRHLAEVAAEDSPETVMGFLDRAVGNRAPRAMRAAFIGRGPAMLHRLEDATEMRFIARPAHPDYLYELEGATIRGRALEPLPFDGSLLGDDLGLVRPPIPEFTILGGMMIDRDDIPHLLNMTRSLRSFRHAAGRIGGYLVQKLRHGRGTRLVMGNALIGRFLFSARTLGVDLLTRTETTALRPLGGPAWQLTLSRGGESRTVSARRGVILATGGFARHPQRRAEMLPHPLPEASPAAPGHTSALHDLVAPFGAHYADSSAQPCYWAPVSLRRRRDGSTAAFPHFVLDRSKPGTICVGRDGRRFINESRSYHEFVAAMYAANRDGSHIPTFLICDAPAIAKYGLGMVRPGGAKLAPYLADGYLTEAPSLAALAAKLGIEAPALGATVRRFNGFAATGVDEDFGRGSTVYERHNGDAGHKPNPTLGPVATAPFYAVRLLPADIGAATGLVTDDHARLLRGDGTAIEGLYAAGADMNSITGGVYPGPGITIGPGIVFGAIAAETAAAAPAARQDAAA